MALLDHFRPPLSVRRHWHSFHNAWATYIAAELNRRLPAPYFAEANVQFGIEIDVATFRESQVGVMSSPLSWRPPAPMLSVPMTVITDVVEVCVYEDAGGPTLSAAIELVSPSNKDRPSARDAFLNKCAAYLQQGVGLVVVDIVTDRHATLHDALLEKVAGTSPSPLGATLFTASYHPVVIDRVTTLETWAERLNIGTALPEMPLWLRGAHCMPLALEATYERTCEEQRVA